MSPEQTIEKMKTMKPSAMVGAYEQQPANPSRFADMGFDERFAMPVDYGSDARRTNKIERLIDGSSMCFKAAAQNRSTTTRHVVWINPRWQGCSTARSSARAKT